MKFVALSMFCLALLFASCEDASNPDTSQVRDESQTESSPKDAEPEMAESAQNKAIPVVTCAEPGYQFQIPIPQDIPGGARARCTMDPVSGLVLVDAGEKFQLDIEMDDNSLEHARLTLEEDLVFTWDISDESASGFIAQAKLPNGQSHYWHVYQTVAIKGAKYFVRSREGANFTKQDVLRMKDAIEAMTVIH